MQRAASPLRAPEPYDYPILLEALKKNFVEVSVSGLPNRPQRSFFQWTSPVQADVLYQEDVPELIAELENAIRTGTLISEVSGSKLKSLTNKLNKLVARRVTQKTADSTKAQRWNTLTPYEQERMLEQMEEEEAEAQRLSELKFAADMREMRAVDAARVCPEHGVHPSECKHMSHSVANWKINNGNRGGKTKRRSNKSKSKSKSNGKSKHHKGKKSHRSRH
jgi:hypothetical protein